MRSLESARESWQELQHYRTLRDLKDAVRLDGHSSIATTGLRSAAWKAFLLFDTLDLDDWQRTLASSRSAYNSLRAHFFRLVDNHDDDFGTADPLSSQDAETSPWKQRHKDEDLRAEILQDVDRCMLEFARSPEIKRILTDVLFVFCKLNPDVGYRQGMHEVAAFILWVVQEDALDLGQSSKVLGEDSIIKTVFDADHIEHDSFALFGQVMQNAKPFYLSEGPSSIAARSEHIFNDLLAQVDPVLKSHLEGLDIVPQVFLIRWIRLLFGREFEFESVLALWDVIFAEDPSLDLVEHICLAMLLRIRWHLLDSDYNNALSLLLRCPEMEKDLPAQTLGLDAMYLKDHMSREGSSYIVLKHTGRPLNDRPTTPPALQRNITTFSGINTARHAGRVGFSPPTVRQARGIEALQNTAKNLYAQGEKLGIGKAVRSAVDEVQRKAQEIRDAQATPPPSQRRSGNIRLIESLRNMEARNCRLAELLSAAVDELWDYQALVSDVTDASVPAAKAESLEKLSTAIANVQLVQVYLNEPTLNLAEEDTRSHSRDHKEQSSQQSLSATSGNQGHDSTPAKTPAKVPGGTLNPESLADPSSFDDFTDTDEELRAAQGSKKAIVTASTAVSRQPSIQLQEGKQAGSSSTHLARPSLEQSAFSFMLGKDRSASSELKRPSAPARTHGALFGAKDEGNSDLKSSAQPSADAIEQDGERDEFFSTLRRNKRGQK